MPALSLPKSALLTETAEYQKVYKAGKRIRGQNFSLIYLANGLAGHRLGISVHGVKLAVKRNRIKRIIREFFRRQRALPDGGLGDRQAEKVDWVFAVRPEFSLDSPAAVAAAVTPLLKKLGLGPAASTGCRVTSPQGLGS